MWLVGEGSWMDDLKDVSAKLLPRNKMLNHTSRALRKGTTPHEDKLWRVFLLP